MRVCEFFFVPLHTIMEMYDYGLSRRFGMALGLRVGIMWIASFLLVVYTFPSLFVDLGIGLGFLALPLAGMNLRRFVQHVDGCVGFRAFWTSWFTYMCAMLVTTAGQYLYFAFLDGGRFVNNLVEMYSSKEVVELNEKLMGSSDMLAQMQQSLEQMQGMSTKETMMMFLFVNIMAAAIFSGFTMLFTIGAKRIKNDDFTM